MGLYSLIGAVTNALEIEMARDENIVIFGEDVGKEGGVFRATEGLQEKFGEKRCFDTILAEANIIGSAVGMAMNGLKPVPEIQFSGFMHPAYNHIASHVARMRNRTRGRYTTPITIRMPYGGGINALESHSESLEVQFASLPGLKLVIPSNPYDAKGLLISAIRDDDPVIFMEPKRIYRAGKQEIPDGEYTVELGKARVIKEGSDLTVVSWGAMVKDTQIAVKELEAKGYSIEIIDLRTIQPWDKETVMNSVKKTGRVAVVNEAVRSFGPAAEIMASVNEDAFLYLEAPATRITGMDIIIPLAQGEHHHMPDPKYIAYKLEEVLKF
ncbi:MAG: alpha-ketoacid dehydrogenase subunit beta [Clostridiales bacterium]|nr:MAG: alpha-ketoacid dehydrogenase subunit beta [Clostridiales bacterium]